MKSPILFLILSFQLLGVEPQSHDDNSHDHKVDGLDENYYQESCPSVTKIARDITWNRVAENSTLVPKLLRLHYHDCFVRGCDASILLDSTDNNTAEKDSLQNKFFAGWEVLDEIKNKLEEVCPQVVSCADIIALVARDAVAFQFGKSMWEVPMGRKDGKVSIASEADTDLPLGLSNFTTLLDVFSRNGLVC